MRAQGYDGTASMSGIHRGVQASMWQNKVKSQKFAPPLVCKYTLGY
jgi:hypothetical protein